jgi:steroid 5-alpha reductase family enzyme
MLDLAAYGWAIAAMLVVVLTFWVVSLVRRDVSVVDSLWSLMFLLVVGVYQHLADTAGPRSWLVLGLVAVWALRLAIYIAVRNHGEPEDRRYQAIRRNNEPNFGFKSLYIVFGLQAALAAFISLPLLVASSASSSLGWLDAIGVFLWLIGMFFEVVGDAQLARFRADPASEGQVLDSGLWRFTRHPNYFGEFTLWWGYYCLALAAGGWWTVLSPVLMSFLLLKVSGVVLLEKDIGHRRAGYAEYIRRTNAFFPGPPRPQAQF